MTDAEKLRLGGLGFLREHGPCSQPVFIRGPILDLVSSFPPHPLEFSRNERKKLIRSNKKNVVSEL